MEIKVFIRSRRHLNSLIDKEKSIIADGLSSVAPLSYQTCSIKNIYLIIMKSTLENYNLILLNFVD